MLMASMVISRVESTPSGGEGGKRDFVVSEYLEDEAGGRRPRLPSMCPFGGVGRCRVKPHGWRARSCGPGFQLLVVACREHGRCFTVYPPGWVPYGRVPVVHADAGCPGSRSQGTGTLFEAACAASGSVLWPEESLAAPGCGKTQYRRIALCGRWLGLDGTRATAELASAELGVGLSLLTSTRQQWQASLRRRERGPLVVQVFEVACEQQSNLLFRLLRAGLLTGACGRAWVAGADGVAHPVLGGGFLCGPIADPGAPGGSTTLSRDGVG